MWKLENDVCLKKYFLLLLPSCPLMYYIRDIFQDCCYACIKRKKKEKSLSLFLFLSVMDVAGYIIYICTFLTLPLSFVFPRFLIFLLLYFHCGLNVFFEFFFFPTFYSRVYTPLHSCICTYRRCCLCFRSVPGSDFSSL